MDKTPKVQSKACSLVRVKMLNRNPSKTVNQTFQAIVMVVLALTLPFAYHIDVGPGPDSIRAMTWEYIEASWYTGFRIWDPLDTLAFTLLRLLFVGMIVGVLVNKTTVRRALLVGVVSEVQPLVVSAALTYLVDWPGDPQVPLYIPIPFMLLVGSVFLILINRHNVRSVGLPVPASERDTEVGMKVTAIMQTITEELDDSGRRAWSKMLALSDPGQDKDD